ncbi:hypothetical protein, conserved [Eimeria necatrix]|uniref:OTU-like cysteine protease domain-containing protein n=1 Tax=Eimeria necatrix TaxID=51315 RepID=U6MS50_9EIME|nr:hypothetical protein, conserved [Eimeria necatrix]CDJ65299.1 hypothetical protein, conserved [Eimeria necatrix]
MACLVAPGAFRCAAAVSVSRSAAATAAAAAAAAAATPAASVFPDPLSGRSAVDEAIFSHGKDSSSMPRAATNAAAAAAAAAALAAMATGTLSLNADGSSSTSAAAAADSHAAAADLMSRRRECLLQALGAAVEAARCPTTDKGCVAAAQAKWISKCAASRSQAQQQQGQQQRLLRLQQKQQPPLQQLPSSISFPSLIYDAASYGLDAARSGLGCMYRGGVFAACSLKSIMNYSQRKQWIPLGPKWSARLKKYNLAMKRADAGGGGDCLFLSVALGLSGSGGRSYGVQELRRAAANKAAGIDGCDPNAAFADGEEEKFMERLAVLASIEEGGDWEESWSPMSILHNKDIYVTAQGDCFDVSTPLGKAKALHYELRLPGNNHWGTSADICALEDALDVGIVVMDDSTGGIYPTGCEEKKRSKYMFIYYVVSLTATP